MLTARIVSSNFANTMSLENIYIDKAILKNIDINIDIDKENLVNIDIDIDIDKEILENIDIDKISNRLEFGISNSPKWKFQFKTLLRFWF